MAVKRTAINSDDQLELFAPNGRTHGYLDSIRSNGGETLARTLPEPRARTGGDRPVARCCWKPRKKTKDRDDHVDGAVHQTEADATAGPRPRLGEMVRERYILIPPEVLRTATT